MVEPIKKTIGGLVLQCDEVRSILEKPGVVGLALGLATPGKSKNVDLVIYAVTIGKAGLHGKEQKVKFKMGAASSSAICQDMNHFKFEFQEYLEKGKFDFAFLRKEEFEHFYDQGFTEILIAGSTRKYGNTSHEIKGEWFTLTATPRLDYTESMGRDFGLAPSTRFFEPCPPIWRPGPPPDTSTLADSEDTLDIAKQISFQKT